MPSRDTRAGYGSVIFASLVAVFLAFFLIYPVGYMLRQAFFVNGEFTFGLFRSLLNDPARTAAIRNSIIIAVSVTLLCAVVATPLAVFTGRYTFPGKRWLTGLILVPMIMPPFVGAIGMRQILSRNGAVDILAVKVLSFLRIVPPDTMGLIDIMQAGMLGVIILETLHLYPIMYLNLAAALANVDPSLEESARNMGASTWRLFRTITLPLTTPGFFAGAIIVFVWGFTDLGTPLMFNFRDVVPVGIFNDAKAANENPTAFALVVVVILISAAAFLLSKRFSRRRAYYMLSKNTRGKAEITLGRTGTVFAYAAFGAITLLAVLPHISVVLMSVAERWFFTVLPSELTLTYYRDIFVKKETLTGITNSLFYSAGSTVFDIVLGVGIAYLLARKRIFGKGALDLVAMMPLALPGFVLAFGYVALFAGNTIWPVPDVFANMGLVMRSNSPGWGFAPADWAAMARYGADFAGGTLFAMLDPLKNPTLLLVVSYSVRRLPFMVRSVYAGFQQISPSLEDASANLGASPSRTLRLITVPLIFANILAGAILCFSFAMLEVSDSLILATEQTFYPITKVIYSLSMDIQSGPSLAAAMGVLGMLLLVGSLVLSGKILGEKMGELFRA